LRSRMICGRRMRGRVMLGWIGGVGLCWMMFSRMTGIHGSVSRVTRVRLGVFCEVSPLLSSPPPFVSLLSPFPSCSPSCSKSEASTHTNSSQPSPIPPRDRPGDPRASKGRGRRRHSTCHHRSTIYQTKNMLGSSRGADNMRE